MQTPTTKTSEIVTLDLNFFGMPGTIAAYLIPHRRGAVLVECGPASTLEGLTIRLTEAGYKIEEISDVLLTHIHLDHAGACGWLARQGARIHVHPAGAPHLINPEKLLSSAARIYGEQMEALWGKFLAVPEDRLLVVQDEEMVEIEDLRFTALATPGHADHHHVYLFEGTCFSGDIGGVRLGGTADLRLPTPPPEFHLAKWRDSLARLRRVRFSRIAPTHFGIYADPHWHLDELDQALDEIEGWMEKVMPNNPSPEELNRLFLAWIQERSLRQGVKPELLNTYEIAIPSWMSAQGISRFWHKHRQPA